MRAGPGARLRGAGQIALGGLAMFTPLFSGEWAIAGLGAILAGAGAIELAQVVRATDRRVQAGAYLGGVVSLLAGSLLFFRPTLVVGGLLLAVAALLLVEGAVAIIGALAPGATQRLAPAITGAIDLAAGLLLWRTSTSLGTALLGVVLGARLLARGWALMLAPQAGAAVAHAAPPGLEGDEEYTRLAAAIGERERARRGPDTGWMAMLVLVFLAIHVGRMQAEVTFLGLIAPLVATAGDVASALLIAVLVLPLRLAWRRATRPVEVRGWRSPRDQRAVSAGQRLLQLWLDRRVAFDARLSAARTSIGESLRLAIRMGLPAVAVVVAVNPIWGFSWYFNTENWASGFWQSVTAARVEIWQTAIGEAVAAGAGVDPVRDAAIWTVQPEGIDAGDFSFLVIGDPGEGDASQHVLLDRIRAVAAEPDVRFVVVSSDVIYPSGEMKDYEFNFHLPFMNQGVPIYAIPGNHDWFNALDAFAANFLTPAAAATAMRARVDADLGFSSTTDARVDGLIAEARRLREAYGVQAGLQRAPWFEIHAEDFAFIAADTGIMRKLDPLQKAWFEEALGRGAGRFTMVLMGHPFFAGGHYQATDPDFGGLHDLTQRHRVPLVMAGDTHDFEYYAELLPEGGVQHHVVNGGGGAYLSIGTALDFPAIGPTPAWAYYPSTAAVTAKLETQTPAWKWPVWQWVKRWKAWPSTVETLSAVFDFNRAPSFQSFVQMRVQRSDGTVRMLVHGVDGPLRWRDLQRGGAVMPPGATEDDAVELVLPLRR